MKRHPRTRPVRRALCALWRLSCVTVALVLLVALAQAGSRYFYCASMSTMSAVPCCEHSAPQSPDQMLTSGSGCCRALTHHAVPVAEAGAGPSMSAPAPLLALAAPDCPRVYAGWSAPVARFRGTGYVGPPPQPVRSMTTVLLI